MAESVRDQIIDAILAKLAAIVGDAGANFWYTPGAARCVEAISIACLDDTFADAVTGKATLYILTPDEEDDIEESTEDVDSIMQLDLLTVRQIDQAAHPMKVEAGVESCRLIQNRLARDAKKKLREDVTLAGLSHNVEIPRTEFAAEIVGGGGVWACVLMRLAIHYSYWKGTP